MKLALFGNQNSGKTSLFNALTGSNQKVGNWPGVTIDRVEGVIKKHNSTIVDLPGVYSLSPYTSEEEISRRFVLDEKVDLIINIVDATSLERSLYLTTQLLELDVDVVVALNMYDLLKHKGIKINVKKLEEELGVTIIPISSKTGMGINRLKEIIFKRRYKRNKHKMIYPDDVEAFIQEVKNEYKYVKVSKNGKLHKRFCAVKILEEDRDYRILMDQKLKDMHLALETTYGMDGEQLIASLRYDYVVRVRRKCARYTKRKETRTDKVDRIFLNKYLAIPIFVLIMAIVYFVSISLVGGLTSGLINTAFNGGELAINIGTFRFSFGTTIPGLSNLLAEGLSSVGASTWAISLITDGVIAGASAVISFVPQLITLFVCLSILETTGYMSRIAFFLDRVFHKIGLSGKSLIPFIVGAGCSVPGVMSTRTIEDQSEKKATIALVPFIPCSAKLPIISLVCAVFFPTWGFALALLFYLMAIIIIFAAAIFIKKIFRQKEHSTFISELPSYKIPSAKYVARDVGDKTWSFIKRAGTVVVFFSVIVCVLVSFTWNFRYVDGNVININESMLAGIGNGFAWFFYPMLGCNWNWAASVSAIQGLIAKEQVISSIRVIQAASGSVDPFAFFTPLTAFAYATFNLFSIPCVATISTMRGELKSVKKVLLVIAGELIVAWVIASVIGVWGVLL